MMRFSMPHTYSSIKIHIIFGTKRRARWIHESFEQELWAYMAGTARNKGFLVLKAGGVEDHIHLLVDLPPELDVSKAVQVIKANSSHWMKRHVRSFAWCRGFAAFSVSESMKMKTIAYITNQKKHHKRKSMDEELRELLRLSGVVYKADGLME